MKLGKLVTAAQAVESGKQRQRYQETGQRTDKREDTRQACTLIRACRQDQHTGNYRHPNCQAE